MFTFLVWYTWIPLSLFYVCADNSVHLHHVDRQSFFHLPTTFEETKHKDNARLFHDQIILNGCDPFDAMCDFTRFIDGLLRSNETAQLNGALKGFDTDLE
jgi:hypothetical protein